MSDGVERTCLRLGFWSPCISPWPGQVNNFFIFPGVSFGAMCCEASHIPDRLFMEAAEAVANSLDKADMELDSVLPSTGRIREVGHNVALRVVLAAQEAWKRAPLHWHRPSDPV